MRKPLTPQQIADDIFKRQSLARKNIKSRVEDTIAKCYNSHHPQYDITNDDIINALSTIINRLTK